MKRNILVLIIMTVIIMCAGCNEDSNSRQDETKKNLSTKEANGDNNISEGSSDSVKEEPSDFLRGIDISSLISLEDSGVCYYDEDGVKSDIFSIISKAGINCVRVRIWNDPYDSSGNGYGGGNSDANKAVEIAKRAAKENISLFVDFHYSDFWADPAKQKAPKQWKSMTIEQKERAVYEFTKETLQKIIDTKAKICMVQTGNEINNGMAGETDIDSVHKLIKSATKAIDECEEQNKISILKAVHYTNPQQEGLYGYYADKLKSNGVDYDVFATSYYPYWHGTIDNVTSVLSNIAKTYNKKVLIAETSYAYTLNNGDGHPNTISDASSLIKEYTATPQGQAEYLKALMNSFRTIGDKALGVIYWEGAWISVKSLKQPEKELWQKYGCGWASSYAGEYDSADAGKWYGGCAVDNQALFDFDGKPLEALKILGKD